MAYLIDTNVLARLANKRDAQHAVASQAVVELHRRGEVLHVTPQVLVEFRNMATRPIALNGLGLSTVDAEAQAAGFEATFPLLAETPDIYPRRSPCGGVPCACGDAPADVQRLGFRSHGRIWAGSCGRRSC